MPGKWIAAEKQYGSEDYNLYLTDRLDRANCLTREANMHFAQRNYPQAESAYWCALEIRRQVLGENHLEIADSLDDLAQLYEIHDQHLEAARFFTWALETRERVLGSYHPLVLKQKRRLSRFQHRHNAFLDPANRGQAISVRPSY